MFLAFCVETEQEVQLYIPLQRDLIIGLVYHFTSISWLYRAPSLSCGFRKIGMQNKMPWCPGLLSEHNNSGTEHVEQETDTSTLLPCASTLHALTDAHYIIRLQALAQF